MAVTELPRSLAPWASKLALFPREVALALSPLVQRLHVLLGEGRGSAGETGEPDGYDGIARRGPYERLLAAEWLIHSELPDEFMRRVVAGEHSFLKLAHRPPTGGRRATVLFDAGPDQLGGPRIAHVAALVVLAARLERRRGTLSWGALQDETASLEGKTSRASVLSLLAARSPRPVARKDVERWLAAEGVRGASERWLVGAEDLRSPEERRSTSMLVVSEVLERGARRLHVQAIPAGSSRPAEVVLDLPPEETCIRILRDPFGAAPSPPLPVAAAPDPEAGLVFSQNGRRLYVVTRKGQLLLFVVPNSPRSPVPPHAVFEPPEGQEVVAAGIEKAKSRTIVVCAGRGSYFSHRMSVSRRIAFESREHRLKGGPVLPPMRPDALAALRVSEEGLLRFTVNADDDVVLGGDDAWYEPRRAGSMEDWTKPFAGLEDPAPLWTFAHAGTTGTRDHHSLGAWLPSGEQLLLVKSGRARVLAQLPVAPGMTELKPVLSTTSPIVATRVVSALGLLGFLTEDGQIGVYSLRAEALVLHSLPEPARP